jgi:hypothetical protein
MGNAAARGRRLAKYTRPLNSEEDGLGAWGLEEGKEVEWSQVLQLQVSSQQMASPAFFNHHRGPQRGVKAARTGNPKTEV